MFNVGGGELLVIMLVALVVLGPQKLPEAARKIGHAMGELRKISSGFQAEMRNALSDADKPDRKTLDGSKPDGDKPAKRARALKPGTTPEQADAEALAAGEPAAELENRPAIGSAHDAAAEPVAELTAADGPAGELTAAEPTVAAGATPVEEGETPAIDTTAHAATASAPGASVTNGATAGAEPSSESAGPASGSHR